MLSRCDRTRHGVSPYIFEGFGQRKVVIPVSKRSHAIKSYPLDTKNIFAHY
jgi:hypothetical protein